MAVFSQTLRKDPNSVLDYGFDWSTWLASGETLSSATWTIPTGITSSSPQLGTDSAKIWLSGGTAGEEYIIACKVVTSANRTDERSFVVQVENR